MKTLHGCGESLDTKQKQLNTLFRRYYRLSDRRNASLLKRHYVRTGVCSGNDATTPPPMTALTKATMPMRGNVVATLRFATS